MTCIRYQILLLPEDNSSVISNICIRFKILLMSQLFREKTDFLRPLLTNKLIQRTVAAKESFDATTRWRHVQCQVTSDVINA